LAFRVLLFIGVLEIAPEVSAPWAEMVARIRTGDDNGSVEELYVAVSRASRGKLFRSIDPQAVEDHVHEIMVIVLEAIRAGELRDPSCLMSFVKTVTHRRVSLHIRGAMLRRRRLVSIDSAPDPPAPVSQSPEERTARREKVHGVRRVIASLPARDREILIRFYYREQDADQICREMSLTANQFRLSKSRAIAKCGNLTRSRKKAAITSCPAGTNP
jgi:RNA polymerase sigma-70 factor, ECF subfamily